MERVTEVSKSLLPYSVIAITFLRNEKIAEYNTLLKNHDWQFEHCDNYRIWGIGNAQRNALEVLRKDVDTDGETWNLYAPIGHRFSRFFGVVSR